MVIDTINQKNDTAEAALRLLELMAMLFCHENKLLLYSRNDSFGYNPDFHENETDDWSRKFLVGLAYESLSVKSSECLNVWVKETFKCPIVIDWSKNRLNRKYLGILEEVGAQPLNDADYSGY